MIRDHRIVVWTVALNEVPDALWTSLHRLLDTDEQDRADRFAFERHRREHIAAHALKRLMLSGLAGNGTPVSAWRFQTGRGGKPRVSGAAGPQFNLSHCDGLAACAVGGDIEVGLDVEPTAREAPFEIAGRFFAPAEVHWLSGLPTAARTDGFFRLWTLKEAFVKATGRGLAQPLRDIAFDFDPLGVAFGEPALGNAADWRFEQRMIRGQYLIAIAWCAKRREVPVAIHEVRLEDLLAETPT